MKNVFPAILATLLIALAGQAAYGCSCDLNAIMKKPNYKKWLKEFDGAAFKGRVLNIEVDEESLDSQVTFAVDSYWRGVDGPEIVIRTTSQSAMCGVYYEIGEERTVLAYRTSDGFRTNSCTEAHNQKFLKGYLKALGKAKKPPKPAPEDTQTDYGQSRLMDEMGAGNCEDELVRLDMLANEVRANPGSLAYLIAYGGKEGKKNEAKARLARMSYYLSENRGVPKPIIVDGGFRENPMVSMWLYYPGEFLPMPSPTLNAKDVKLKGVEKIRGYNCADEMGSQ